MLLSSLRVPVRYCVCHGECATVFAHAAALSKAACSLGLLGYFYNFCFIQNALIVVQSRLVLVLLG